MWSILPASNTVVGLVVSAYLGIKLKTYFKERCQNAPLVEHSKVLRLRTIGGFLSAFTSHMLAKGTIAPPTVPLSLEVIPSFQDCKDFAWSLITFRYIQLPEVPHIRKELFLARLLDRLYSLISYFGSDGFVRRYWFILLPALIVFTVSTMSMLGRRLPKRGGLSRFFRANQREIRGVCLLSSSVILFDAAVRLFIGHSDHYFWMSLRFAFYGIVSATFGLDNVTKANFKYSFYITPIFLFMTWLALLTQRAVGALSWLCLLGFYATAEERGIFPILTSVPWILTGLALVPAGSHIVSGYKDDQVRLALGSGFACIGIGIVLAPISSTKILDEVARDVLTLISDDVPQWLNKAIVHPFVYKVIPSIVQGIKTCAIKCSRMVTKFLGKLKQVVLYVTGIARQASIRGGSVAYDYFCKPVLRYILKPCFDMVKLARDILAKYGKILALQVKWTIEQLFTIIKISLAWVKAAVIWMMKILIRIITVIKDIIVAIGVEIATIVWRLGLNAKSKGSMLASKILDAMKVVATLVWMKLVKPIMSFLIEYAVEPTLDFFAAFVRELVVPIFQWIKDHICRPLFTFIGRVLGFLLMRSPLICGLALIPYVLDSPLFDPAAAAPSFGHHMWFFASNFAFCTVFLSIASRVEVAWRSLPIEGPKWFCFNFVILSVVYGTAFCYKAIQSGVFVMTVVFERRPGFEKDFDGLVINAIFIWLLACIITTAYAKSYDLSIHPTPANNAVSYILTNSMMFGVFAAMIGSEWSSLVQLFRDAIQLLPMIAEGRDLGCSLSYLAMRFLVLAFLDSALAEIIMSISRSPRFRSIWTPWILDLFAATPSQSSSIGFFVAAGGLAMLPIAHAQVGVFRLLCSYAVFSTGMATVSKRYNRVRGAWIFSRNWLLFRSAIRLLFLYSKPLLSLGCSALLLRSTLIHGIAVIGSSDNLMLMGFECFKTLTFAMAAHQGLAFSLILVGSVWENPNIVRRGQIMFSKILRVETLIMGMYTRTGILGRSLGGFVSSYGKALLRVSRYLWTDLVRPILRTCAAFIEYAWKKPATSWIASVGLIIALYWMNRLGLDELATNGILNAVRIIPVYIGKVPIASTTEGVVATALHGARQVVHVVYFAGYEVNGWLNDLRSGNLMDNITFVFGSNVLSFIIAKRAIHNAGNEDFNRVSTIPVIIMGITAFFLHGLAVPSLVVSIFWVAIGKAILARDRQMRRAAGRAYNNQVANLLAGKNSTQVAKILPKEDDLTKVFSSEDCVICTEPIVPKPTSEDMQSSFLPCGHQFHSTCITQWLNQQMRCPICREPVRLTERMLNAVF